MDGVVEGERGRGGEGDLVGEVVGVVGGKAGDAGEGDLLLGQFGFQRDDALLLGELFDFAAVHVDLGDEADLPLLLRLLEESGCGVELRVGGGDALFGCDDLEIRAADREDDGVSGIAGGELRGVDGFAGCAEVVPCGEIEDRLRDAAAQVDVVVRADDGGEIKAGDGNVDAQAFGGEVGLRQVLGEVAADVGKQRAACDLALPLGLERGAVEVCRAKVEVEAALDGVAQRELAGEWKLAPCSMSFRCRGPGPARRD